ncbi:hypothetical protein [Enterococcus faecium]|uniref:hypothetical protein n=1 Tax=Enterococcus faecium TaxID=1352 RepID=UPI001EDCA083|nr:hypothetical protein [Enterococcus faecium]MCG4569838.1 hypothetical protein [Enterococcus faecium]
MNNQGDWLEIDNVGEEDFSLGSVIIHEKKDKYGHKIFAKIFVWDLIKDYELVNEIGKEK